MKIDSASADGFAQLDLGIVYTDASRKHEALRELREAEKLDPDDMDVHWRLARFYQADGKKEEAMAEVNQTCRSKQAANATIFSKLEQAQERGRSGQEPSGAAPSN